MSISVSVDTSKLDAIIARLPGNRDKIVRATAFHILGEAQKRAPYKTGWLHDHAQVNTDYASSGFVNVEFTAEYAAYVELGTHKMPGRPFLKNSVEAETELLTKRIKDGLIQK